MKKLKAVLYLALFVIVLCAAAAGGLFYAQRQRNRQAAALTAAALEKLNNKDWQGALEAADQILKTFGKRLKDPAQIRHVRAKALEGLGRSEEALKDWAEIRKNHPAAPQAADALAAIAESELAKGTDAGRDAAHEIYREIESKFAGSPAHHLALWGFARIDLADGQMLSAQATLLRLLDEAPEFPFAPQAEEALSELNMKILRSSLVQEGEQIYEIKKGDALVNIGKRFKVNHELIMMVNGISDPKKLRLGQQIKIPNIEFSIRVDKGKNTLTLLNHGKFFKRYRVRTGKQENQTPNGKYKIHLKEKNPTWYHEGQAIPPLDPKNELGTRWMAFGGSTLGIHGTIDPNTIGQYASEGCVGMLTADVEELYDLVPINTPVEIVGQRAPARTR